jgi:hypothetical protein
MSQKAGLMPAVPIYGNKIRWGRRRDYCAGALKSGRGTSVPGRKVRR